MGSEMCIRDSIDIDTMVPDWLSPYVTIDFEQLGNEAASDFYVSKEGCATHLFQP